MATYRITIDIDVDDRSHEQVSGICRALGQLARQAKAGRLGWPLPDDGIVPTIENDVGADGTIGAWYGLDANGHRYMARVHATHIDVREHGFPWPTSMRQKALYGPIHK